MSTADVERVLRAIETEGMILVQDLERPSLTTLVAGEPVSGSWWGPAKSKLIFDVINEIEDHADVARFKLVDGKVCLVHRRHWEALAYIGKSKSKWQLEGLSEYAKQVLEQVERGEAVTGTGPHIKELETRLLCLGDQKHMESGEHATELLSWKAFAEREGLSLKKRSLAKAKAELAQITKRWADAGAKKSKLPWD